MNSILKISSLNIGYEKNTIVSAINLSIDEPQFISLIGRNGQGKSTLLKTISGLIPSISGAISYAEKQLSSISVREKSTLFSIVLPHAPQIGTISVRDFVYFGRYPYSNWLATKTQKDNLIVDEALDLCGLTNFAQRNYTNLSDGERQKVAIARAIAQQTPIIILDEPTAHLDLVNQKEIFELLKKLALEKQKTILLSTHQLHLAIHYSNRIWLLNNGTIEANNPTYFIENKIFEQLFNYTIS